MKSTKELVLLPLLAAILSIVVVPSFATTGMSNCTEEPDNSDCNPQPDRVGNDDDPSEDADRDGPGGDDGAGQEDDDDTGEANCWGKVTSSLTKNDDGKPGIGEHSSDPVPNDDDNETPREGVGNQAEGHPSDHADQFHTVANIV
jgi:hypothetical protein